MRICINVSARLSLGRAFITHICRDDVTSFDHDKVSYEWHYLRNGPAKGVIIPTWDNRLCRDGNTLSSANDYSTWGRELTQGIHSFLSFVFLEEADAVDEVRPRYACSDERWTNTVLRAMTHAITAPSTKSPTPKLKAKAANKTKQRALATDSMTCQMRYPLLKIAIKALTELGD